MTIEIPIRNSVLEIETKNSVKKVSIKEDHVEGFRAKIWPQWYAAIAAQVGGFGLGAVWFWSATALPDMACRGDLGIITNSNRSWITAISQGLTFYPYQPEDLKLDWVFLKFIESLLGLFITLSALAVCPICGYCMSRFGRKKSMLWSTIPCVAGWFLIAFAPTIPIVYLGRFMLGGASGIFGQIVPLYTAELSEVKIRGTLMCMYEIMLGLGTIFAYTIGAFFSWRYQAFICGFIPILGHIFLVFVPESPYFLMEQNRDEDAAKALVWLRGATSIKQIDKELIQISDCVREKTAEVENIGWRALKDAWIFKPILISLGLMSVFHFSFILVIMAAAVEIFQSAGSIDKYLSTILIGITKLFAVAIPLVIADKYGRRVLILISIAIASLSLTMLGGFFHFKENYGDIYGVENIEWIPLAILIFYVIGCGIGIVPLTWVVMGEIIPPKAKGMSTTIIQMWHRAIGFFVLYIFWDMIKYLGQDGTYWTIAGVNLISAGFILICVPETKGKSLHEIQMHFSPIEITKL